MAYCPIPIYNLHYSVGKGGTNRPTDVMLVEALFEMSFRCPVGVTAGSVVDQGIRLPSPPKLTGICGDDLITWITWLQKSCVPYVPRVDGRFDPIPSANGFIMDAQVTKTKRYSLYYLITTAFKVAPREYLGLVGKLKMPYMALLDDQLISVD